MSRKDTSHFTSHLVAAWIRFCYWLTTYPANDDCLVCIVRNLCPTPRKPGDVATRDKLRANRQRETFEQETLLIGLCPGDDPPTPGSVVNIYRLYKIAWRDTNHHRGRSWSSGIFLLVSAREREREREERKTEGAGRK